MTKLKMLHCVIIVLILQSDESDSFTKNDNVTKSDYFTESDIVTKSDNSAKTINFTNNNILPEYNFNKSKSLNNEKSFARINENIDAKTLIMSNIPEKNISNSENIVEFSDIVVKQNGAIFKNYGKLKYLDGMYYAVTEIEFNHTQVYINQLYNLIKSIYHKKRTNLSNFDQHTKIAYHNLIQQSREMLFQYEILLDEIEVSNIRPFTRSRRGTFNFVGAGLNWYFGVATDSELTEINSRIGKIQNNNNKMIQTLNTQTAILHNVAEGYTILNRTASEAKEIAFQIQKTFSKKQSVNKQKFRQLELQTITNNLQTKMNGILRAVEKLRAGFITPDLVHRNAIVELIKQIGSEGHSLIMEGTNEIAHFYEIARAMIIPSTEKTAIRFAIIIPLSYTPNNFDLYELSTIPTWFSNLNIGVKYRHQHKFLGVSSDRKIFTPLQDLSLCLTDAQYYLCAIKSVFFTNEHENCEVDLFKNKNIESNITCPRDVYTNINPSFHKTKEGFLYNCPQPQNMTLECKIQGVRTHIKNLTLTGIGNIQIQPQCTLFGKGLFIQTTTTFKNQLKEVLKIEPYTTEPFILTQDEIKLFKNKAEYVQKTFQSSNKIQPIEEMVKNLEYLKIQEVSPIIKTLTHYGSILSTPVLILIIIILILIAIFYCYTKINKTHLHQSPLIVEMNPQRNTRQNTQETTQMLPNN